MTEVWDIPDETVEAAADTWPKIWEEYNLRKALRRALTAAYPALLAHLDKSAADNKVLVAENARLTRERDALWAALKDTLEIASRNEAGAYEQRAHAALTEAKKP